MLSCRASIGLRTRQPENLISPMIPARTRIAPSPTGYMHIGTLRTMLYNYFLARQTGGQFLVRIEDTDRERMVEGAVENLLGVIRTLGIDYDEGPVLQSDGTLLSKGDVGPYVQSERLLIYQEHVEKLIAKGDAYYCFCTRDRLDAMRQQQMVTKQTPKYDRTCCSLTEDDVTKRLAERGSYVIRMKVPEGETLFMDAVRGAIKIANSEVDDQVLLKSDGFPTYHLAVVVDDHLMNITHVIRGEEWISSTPKHVMLYTMFGWNAPQFAHLPLLLNPDKSKLSKRQGDVAVEDYLKRGYLPEALINFVALLGFNPKGDQELYTVEEFTKLFDLSKVNKSGAVLNMEKLDWMNNQYLRAMEPKAFFEAARPFLQVDVSHPIVERALLIERERVSRLDELQEHIGDYLVAPGYDPQSLVWKKADKEDAKEQLENVLRILTDAPEANFAAVESMELLVKSYVESNGLSNGNVLWPLRVALSGKERSASPFELLWALGKEESLVRIGRALDLL